MSCGPSACRQSYEFVEDLQKGIINSEGESNKNSNKIPKSPHILCNIKGFEVWSLVDTGSQISAISEEFYNELNKDKNFSDLPVSNIMVSTAIGKKSTSVKKQIYVEIDIDGQITPYVFLVIPCLSDKIILGNDFHLKCGIIINYWIREISLKNRKISDSQVLFE